MALKIHNGKISILGTCVQDEPLFSPYKPFSGCVIVQYLWSFFEHPVSLNCSKKLCCQPWLKLTSNKFLVVWFFLNILKLKDRITISSYALCFRACLMGLSTSCISFATLYLGQRHFTRQIKGMKMSTIILSSSFFALTTGMKWKTFFYKYLT